MCLIFVFVLFFVGLPIGHERVHMNSKPAFFLLLNSLNENAHILAEFLDYIE